MALRSLELDDTGHCAGLLEAQRFLVRGGEVAAGVVLSRFSTPDRKALWASRSSSSSRLRMSAAWPSRCQPARISGRCAGCSMVLTSPRVRSAAVSMPDKGTP